MNYQKRPQPNQNSQPRFRKWIVVAIVLVAVGAGVVGWAVTHKHDKKEILTGTPAGTSTADPNAKGEPAKTGDASGTASGQNSDGSTKTPSGSAPDTNATLTAPYGNFVSNHKPNLDGSPAPNSEQSICNTSAGANCQIIFTKGSVTKTLSAQAADSGGAVYWEWTLQQVGLTEGTWKVSAKATLGSQTKTTDDVIPFEVGP